MTEHSPEPWKREVATLYAAPPLAAYIGSYIGNTVALHKEGSTGGQRAIADAERIVLCINFCTGVPSDLLLSMSRRTLSLSRLLNETRQIGRLKVLLRRVVEPFEGVVCKLDHQGFCQAHFSEKDCTVAAIRAVLSEDSIVTSPLETAPPADSVGREQWPTPTGPRPQKATGSTS